MRRKRNAPVVAMRGKVVLPGSITLFDINRKRSMAAVEEAMVRNEKVFLVAQKNPEELDPTESGLFEYGTLSEIRQLARLPQAKGRVLVEGVQRCRLSSLENGKELLTADVVLQKCAPADPSEPETEAMLRVAKGKVADYARQNSTFADKYMKQLMPISDLEEFLEKACAALPWDWRTAQKLLECATAEELYRTFSEELSREIQITEISRDFKDKLRANLDRTQRDYVLREQLKLIRQELGDREPQDEAAEYEAKCDKLEAEPEVKQKIRREIARFRMMSGSGQEAGVLQNYLETVLELPWGHCSRDSTDLKAAERILNENHYGLERVKERILDYLAVRMLNPESRGPILCLVGPPGTGKTSIARSAAQALGRKYVRISLGGVRDEAEIRGHRRTYVGAMPGRIAEGLKEAGTANPLMLLDEIDKISPEYRGAAASALLEVLDSAQNSHFRDAYIGMPLDLSKVLFIATANMTDTIPEPLLDRMEIITLSSYTENEKFHIAKQYLVPKQREASGLLPSQITIRDTALKKIIHSYTREAGVRETERKIGEICRKSARDILENRAEKVIITKANLMKYLGAERVRCEDDPKPDEIGVAHGLAWTSAGGVILEVEVSVLPGRGDLNLTGQMGDVMKESAQTAVSCVRRMAPDFGIRKDFFEKHDIHIHIPEGAVPKDGPSAGVTIATAVLSAVTEIPVRGTTAMTGEITLRGHILMIGGIREKLLAARAAHMKRVLVPEENLQEVKALAPAITRGIEIVPVRRLADAVREALERGEGGETEPPLEETESAESRMPSGKRRKREFSIGETESAKPAEDCAGKAGPAEGSAGKEESAEGSGRRH